MKKNFWGKFKKPILVLAPMYNVTDSAFRQMIVKIGKPNIIFTEFVSADGLVNKRSRKKLIKLHLRYKKNERPIVAQIFGANPDTIYQASILIKKLKFDGLDINMGCPDKKVVKNGYGAALIKNPSLAKNLIQAAKEGFGGPISVKTRIGFNENKVEEWVSDLADAEPDVVIMHGRIKKEMSKVPADWIAIAKGAKIVRERGILYLGNGDVENIEEASWKALKYNLDGVMIGRGVLKNLMIFNGVNFLSVSLKKRVELMIKHAKLFEKYFGGLKSFSVFKKHIGNYVFGFNGALLLRNKLMKTNSASDLEFLINSINMEDLNNN